MQFGGDDDDDGDGGGSGADDACTILVDVVAFCNKSTLTILYSSVLSTSFFCCCFVSHIATILHSICYIAAFVNLLCILCSAM